MEDIRPGYDSNNRTRGTASFWHWFQIEWSTVQIWLADAHGFQTNIGEALEPRLSGQLMLGDRHGTPANRAEFAIDSFKNGHLFKLTGQK